MSSGGHGAKKSTHLDNGDTDCRAPEFGQDRGVHSHHAAVAVQCRASTSTNCGFGILNHRDRRYLCNDPAACQRR